MRTLKATLCVILCCVSVRTTGQEMSPDGYLQLVRRFAGGDLDGATGELAAWVLGPSTVTSQPQARRRPRAAFLLDAENEFRKALNVDSAFVEARVRLGRVLSLKGDRAAARTD